VNDFVPIIPLQLLNLNGYERLFFIIKIVRLYSGFKLFNVPMIMNKIKVINNRKMMKIIETDKMKAEDTLEDNNNITKMIMINFLI